MIRIHLIIRGKVQGVFFRDHSVEKALEIGGVYGWVANQADGTVIMEIEGPENKVNQLVDWCHSGPSGSEVKKVEAEKCAYTKEFDHFEIRY